MELDTLLDKLKMEALADQLDAVCEQAAKRDLDYWAFLAEALRTGRQTSGRTYARFRRHRPNRIVPERPQKPFWDTRPAAGERRRGPTTRCNAWGALS